MAKAAFGARAAKAHFVRDFHAMNLFRSWQCRQCLAQQTSPRSAVKVSFEPKVALFGRVFKLAEWRIENEKRAKDYGNCIGFSHRLDRETLQEI